MSSNQPPAFGRLSAVDPKHTSRVRRNHSGAALSTGQSASAHHEAVTATIAPSAARAAHARPGAAAGERDREKAGRTPAQRGEVPPHLSLVRRVRFASREVVLVTYDSDRHELTAVEHSPRAAR
jgi:hypothetical protein